MLRLKLKPYRGPLDCNELCGRRKPLVRCCKHHGDALVEKWEELAEQGRRRGLDIC